LDAPAGVAVTPPLASDIVERMHRRALAPLMALSVAACGEAFTAATSDGSAPGDAASLDDTGVVGVDGAPGDDDARVSDATIEDATSGGDAAREDADHGKGDASTGNLDAGPVPEASLCVRACPVGFDCVVTQCEDRAALHFSATNNNPANWSYGWAAGMGAMFQLDSSHWVSGSTIDVWTNTGQSTFEPSVFHNSALAPQMVDEMTIPGAALGLYSGAMVQASLVRWNAPVTGTYAIDATFTGISAPLTTVNVGVTINNVTGPGTGIALNEFGGGNTFTYSVPAQTLTPTDNVDFYVTPISNRDDPPGGVSLDARITAP
jgi:hypothetical protein